jgi:tryptophan synthase beta chain
LSTFGSGKLKNHNIMSDKRKRYILPEEEIPHYWYNIQADMVNKPMPPLHPGTKQPLKAEDLYPIFAKELCQCRVQLM